MMRRLRVRLARRLDQAGRHAVDGDLRRAQIVRQRAGEADQAGLGGDDVQRDAWRRCGRSGRRC